MTTARRPIGKRRGRGASGKGHASSGGGGGNTTKMVAVGATVATDTAVNNANNKVQVGA